MFSILKKPQNTINAEDLELLQNEIEGHLVNNVKQRWKLERLAESSSIISPESSALPASGTGGDGTTFKCTTTSSQSAASLPTGKLRNSMKLSHIETESEDATDGFKNSIYATNNSSNGTTNGPNSNETDSISSESSLTSILTGSTIITGNLVDSNQQLASNKRALKNSTSDRPSKRFRHNSSNSVPTAGGGLPKRPPHSKHRSKIIPSKFRNSIEESRPNKKQVLKNEAPDKLWPFVEQFCLPPTEKQIQELEEMLESMENDQEYYKVPPSLKQESSEIPAKTDATINNHLSTNKNPRKSRSKNDVDASLGALTQRVVSSFIEEAGDNSHDQSRSGSDASSPPTKKRKSKVSKCLDNANNVEKKIRQQLEEHSILTPQDDIPYNSEQNETLRELSARQHELLSIQTDIRQTIRTFINEAKKRNALEALRSELEIANANVRSAYYRYISAKQKKRNPTKKERDAAYKAVREHQEIFDKCDALYRIVNRSHNP